MERNECNFGCFAIGQLGFKMHTCHFHSCHVDFARSTYTKLLQHDFVYKYTYQYKKNLVVKNKSLSWQVAVLIVCKSSCWTGDDDDDDAYNDDEQQFTPMQHTIPTSPRLTAL